MNRPLGVGPGRVAVLLAVAAAAAVAVVVLVVAVVVGGGNGDGEDATTGTDPSTTTTPAPTTSTSTSTSTSTTVAPTTTAPPATTTTTAPPTTGTPTTTAPPTTAPPGPATLRPGDAGPEVRSLQQRLIELRYWLGPTDGVYGHLTEQAVLAFQKVNGLGIDGVVGPATRERLADPAPASPRSSRGAVFEVDKSRQVLLAVQDGEVRWIWNTSTGTEQPYVHDGVELLADTPTGRFTISWQVDGWRDGALGRMWRPKYFHPDGIAIHGYHSVPAHPASHGCVRVTITAMNAIWEQGLAPVGSPVWVYGTSPV